MSYTSHAPEIITETLRENGEFTTGHWSWSRRGGGVGVGARLMLKMGLKYMAGFSFEIGGGHPPISASGSFFTAGTWSLEPNSK